MGYLGRTPTPSPVTVDDIPANSIDASKIVDGAITIADIADDAVTLAKMAGGTDGQIITYDASGNPVTVGPGTDGQVLTSTGAGSPPAFETAAAGGKVLQVVSSNLTTSVTTSSTSWTATGHSASITPQTGSKVLFIIAGGGAAQNSTSDFCHTTMYRGATNLGHTNYGLETHGGGDPNEIAPHSVFGLDDSPGGNGSTSITYQAYFLARGTTTAYYNHSSHGHVKITLIEIGA